MATNTYVALKATTVTGSAASSVTLDLTGIAGYTDLVIVSEAKTSSGAGGWLQFNSDTNANYSFTILYGETPSTISSYRQSSQTAARYTYAAGIGSTDGTKSMSRIQIQNYSNSSTYKTFIARSNRASNGIDAIVGLWRSTAAITSVTLYPLSDTFSIGSTFTVYGIANADNFTKATGGIISEDSTYTYHVFGSTGTFTPKQSLTADILVVAGGGGAGDGGGGAGGLLYYAAQSLTATGYTCTVGAGGSAGKNATSNATAGGNSQFGSLTLSAGGGLGGTPNVAVVSYAGGSGGGSNANSSGGTGTSGQGNNGGSGYTDNASYDFGGGGGGAGAVGGNATSTSSGAGGNGVSTYSSWGLATGIGQNVSGTYWIAGGGAGGGGKAGVGSASTIGAAGNGGGGSGWWIAGSGAPTSGTPNTGGGGGGGTSSNFAGNGGSGVIIIRYPK